jgi:hypothetical protein
MEELHFQSKIKAQFGLILLDFISRIMAHSMCKNK